MIPVILLIFVIVAVIAALVVARSLSNLKRDVTMLVGLIDLKFDDEHIQRVILYPKTNSMAGKFIVNELGAEGIAVEDYFLADEVIRSNIEEGIRKLGLVVTAEFDGKYLDHLEIRRN